ncbi:MAG: hypothetical protein ACI93R_001033 [Flavobacteriales bacterium]|jgi:hypothetical protein
MFFVLCSSYHALHIDFMFASYLRHMSLSSPIATYLMIMSKIFAPQRYAAIPLTLIVFILSTFICTSYAEDQRYTFALTGDFPYGVKPGTHNKDLDQLVAQINAAEPRWLLHVGDIKNGGESCGDHLFRDREQRFSRFNTMFILSPGDNEWTDCHRKLAGNFDPLERLDALRKRFYSPQKAKKLHKNLGLVTQANTQKKFPEFVENSSWSLNGVRFATIHIVGSHNGRYAFAKLSKKKRAPRKQEIAHREDAALAWLNYTFGQADKNQEKAIMIAIHANPGLGGQQDKSTTKAYAFFIKALHKKIKAFKKPVVLTHGDSHYFRIDKPKLGSHRSPKNFTRVEVFGDSNNDWLEVHVDPNSHKVFSFEIHDN